MKCPKCGYLGFEPADRCRNCGYDFLLAPAAVEPDLTLRNADDHAPLSNLEFTDAAAPRPAAASPREREDANLRSESVPPPGADLPLFGSRVLGDEPLITKASPPRAPLAVRRTTPVPRRSGSKPARPQPDLSLNLEPGPAPPSDLPSGLLSPDGRVPPAVAPGEVLEPASLGARAVAAFIDVCVLAAVDLAVVYFTIQVCGLRFLDVLTLPKIPLAAFLLVQNGGYLVAFTACGQTLGKMATGIRIVSTDSDSVGVGAAARRTAIWLILAAPAGLGLLSVLLGSEHRGLHDRLARTRVVRAASVA
jgi:uncharacterized RDD family membrane protein YckC